MSDNSAPELLVSLDGGNFDSGPRAVSLFLGWQNSWSYSQDVAGWFEWFLVSCPSPLLCTNVRFNFDEGFRNATLGLIICGCFDILACLGLRWSMEDITPLDQDPGTTWSRKARSRCYSSEYTLRRVMDADGRRVQPAFNAMMETLHREGHPGVPVGSGTRKTLMQLTQRGRFLIDPDRAELGELPPAQKTMSNPSREGA